MTEIELAQQQQELEILKQTQPRWSLADNEPFAKSAQQDVQMPVWDKVKFPDILSQSGDGGNSSSFQAIVALNGVPYYAQVNGFIQGPVPL